MTIKQLKSRWEALARQDAMWAVLTDEAKVGGAWKPEEFYQTGKVDVRNALAWLKENDIAVDRAKALDFGCGLGRLSAALSEVRAGMISLTPPSRGSTLSRIRRACAIRRTSKGRRRPPASKTSSGSGSGADRRKSMSRMSLARHAELVPAPTLPRAPPDGIGLRRCVSVY